MLTSADACISLDCDARLRVMQRLAHVGFWELDLVSGMLYWSDEIYRIFELDPGSFTPSYEGFLNTIHPDDRDAVNTAYQRSLQTRAPYEIRHRLLMADGRVKFVDENCETIFAEDGRPQLSRGTVQDVTDGQRVRLELEESRARTQGIIDSMHAFVGLCAIDGTLIETNRYPLEQSGLVATEVLGSPLWKSYWFAHLPETQQQVRAALQQAASGVTARLDLQLRMGIASRMTGDFTFGPILDSAGRIASLVVYGVDVSQRRCAENALAHQEHKLRNILDSHPECVKLVARDCQLLDINPAGLAMIEADSIEQVRGKNILDLIAEKDRVAFQEMHDRIYQGANETMEFEIIGLKGRRRTMETRAVPIALGAEHSAVLEVTRDITSSKSIERTLAALNTALTGDAFFAHITECMTQVLDAEIGFITELTGDQHQSASTRAFIIDGALIPNASYALRDTPCAEILQHGYGCIPDHLQALFPRALILQQLGAVAYVAIPLINTQHQTIGLIGIIKRRPIADAADIQSILQILSLRTAGEMQRERQEGSLRELNDTLELRVSERTNQLVAAKDEAERANNAKTEFLSRMSHELRTPMNAILGYTQLLEADASLQPQQREDVRLIANSGWHLLDLINDLLDFTKIEAGRLDLLLETVVVQDVVADCIATIAPLASKHKVSINPPSSPCPCLVSADRIRLRQVLINLLTNAIKYNKEGGCVSVDCHPGGDGYNHIVVRDTGIGIREEDMSLLFQPFSRLYLETYAIEGSGIGLALSKQLAEAMGGSIVVSSEKGKGSTFTVELPLAGEVPLPFTGPITIDNETSAQTLLLYIEDSPAHIRLVKDILISYSSLELIATPSPELGVELASCHVPDLILLDINLPDMNSFDVLRLLQANLVTKKIPVIALSASAMGQDIQHGRESGFFDYLTKPLQIQQFLDAIARALGKADLA